VPVAPTGRQVDTATILVSGLVKSYPTQSGPLLAVDDVSFEVARGDVYALVGPSGCGKSTILKIVGGLTEFDEGTVSVSGQPAAEGRRDVGIMFQTPVLLPWRTVLRNILLPFEIIGEGREAGERRAVELLDLVGLGDFADKYPWELSGGMQQRAALCRVLVTDPSLLLMDEPLAALDEFTRERLIFEIAAVQEQLSKTMLYVTHDIEEALALADHVVVMTSHPGRVAGIVDVDLPRPRTVDLLEDPLFGERVRRVRELLREGP
jgi:NitT/TauT family transport system ATP-binding protein